MCVRRCRPHCVTPKDTVHRYRLGCRTHSTSLPHISGQHATMFIGFWLEAGVDEGGRVAGASVVAKESCGPGIRLAVVPSPITPPGAHHAIRRPLRFGFFRPFFQPLALRPTSSVAG